MIIAVFGCIIVSFSKIENLAIVNYDIETFDNEASASSKSGEVYIYDADGNQVGYSDKLSGSIEINAANLWNPGAPYLYNMRVVYKDDEYELPFGIRKVEVTQKEFLVNDKPVYLKGFGKHEDSDIKGKGLDLALNVRDFELMKWIGANSFRTSHYPYSEEIMQMADRQGFLIIDEIPAVGMNYFSDETVFCDEKVNQDTLEYHKSALKELYERDKNYACVIMWSVTNEPHSSEERSRDYFKEVTDCMRALDTSRPITGTMSVPVDEDKISQFFDVICINRYFGWYNDTVLKGKNNSH